MEGLGVVEVVGEFVTDSKLDSDKIKRKRNARRKRIGGKKKTYKRGSLELVSKGLEKKWRYIGLEWHIKVIKSYTHGGLKI